MEFADAVIQHASKIQSQTAHLKTEAATSTALVLPFIQALGYNVFDPTEVEPEFTADVGGKKGEKVDYALKVDARPVVLIEVKHWATDLGSIHASQLFRYFTAEASVRFGILTNGIEYRFYSDLESANRMDETPFLIVDLTALVDASSKSRTSMLDALRRFSKARFDADDVAAAAGELRYKTGLRQYLEQQLQNPDDDFIALLARQVHSGNLTKAVRERFAELVKRAFGEFIAEKVDDRLQSAIKSRVSDDDAAKEEALPPGVHRIEGAVVTTEEEMEGYRIVKAIMGAVVDPSRVAMRDTKSYCSVLLDDNNRRPICRFYFDGAKKQVGVFGAGKKEDRVVIESIEDLYRHAEAMRAVARLYDPALGGPEQNPAVPGSSE